MNKFKTIGPSGAAENGCGIDLSMSNGEFRLTGGIEIGVIGSFYSMENPQYGGGVVENFSFVENDEGYEISGDVSLAKGRFFFCEKGKISQDSGFRKLDINFRNDVELMDYVVRFKIKKDLVQHMYIGDEIIPHMRRNKYHQRNMCDVVVVSNTGEKFNFTPSFSNIIKGMVPVSYVRDEPNYWIIHFRVIAMRPEIYAFKGCHKFYNRIFPQWVQNIINFIPGLKNNLLYVRERFSQKIPFQVNGAVVAQSGNICSLMVGWSKEIAQTK